MNRRWIATSSLAVAALLVSGCSAFSDDTGDRSDGGGDGLRVVAAFYPLAYVTERVLGEHGTVDQLTAPGTEPHDLEPTVRETALIADADLVVMERDFQPAIDAAVDQNATGEIVDAAGVVDLVPFDEHSGHHDDSEASDSHGEDDHAHEGEETHAEDDSAHEEAQDDHAGVDDHDHDHGDLDPHFWLDPVRLAQLGDAVAARLADVDPDHAEDFEANAAALRADLESLDEELTTGLDDCDRSTIVVSHDAFGYLDKYGIDIEGVAGLTPDAEPTPAGLASLQRLIAEDGITTVFSERLASPRLTDSLARDAGVATAVLDPIEGLTDETSDEDYVSLMEQNLAALREANGCR